MKSPFIHLVLALLVCAAALIGYGAWYGAVSAKSDSVAALQSQIGIATQTVSRLSTARSTLAELSSDETTVQNYFVPETGIVPFIDGLQAQGSRIGTAVKVLSVSTGGTTAKPTLQFSISVDGTFDGVLRTVGVIEYAPYAISISNLSIEQLAKNTWRAQLTLIVGSRAATATTTP